MRTLAIFAGAFSAGIFAAQYLIPADWLLSAAAAAFLTACAALLLRTAGRTAIADMGRRILLAGTAVSLALGYQWIWIHEIIPAAATLSGTECVVEMVLHTYPIPTPYGAQATVRVKPLPGLAVYYGEASLLDCVPGNVVRDTVRMQDARRIREDNVTSFTSRGVFLLAYGKGEPVYGEGSAGSIRWFPVRFSRSVRDQVRSLLSGDEAAFLCALLTGDRSGLSVQASADLSEAGLSHVLAASGMHCGFVAAAVALVLGRTGRGRRILPFAAIPLVWLYALSAGGTPSVVRAAGMLSLFLCAPLFRRRGDAVTAFFMTLSGILAGNPFAAGSVSLQLSFASVAGLLWVTPGLLRLLNGDGKEEGTEEKRTEKAGTEEEGTEGEETEREETGKTKDGDGRKNALNRIRQFLAVSVSATLGVLAFTAPLSCVYFGGVSLIAPLSNLLTLWAVGGCFTAGWIATGLGFLCQPLGRIAVLIPGGLARYGMTVAHALSRIPLHSVQTANPYLWAYLAYGYLLFLIARLFAGPLPRRDGPVSDSVWTASGSDAEETASGPDRHKGSLFPFRRLYGLAALLAALSLGVVIRLGYADYHGALDAVVLDVGQGQSIALASGERFALVDCGSGNSWYHAGTIAADHLRAMGCRRLDALILTHYDADHVNGLEALLARMQVNLLLLPDTGEPDHENQNAVVALAADYGIPIRYLRERERILFGGGTLTIFPPFPDGSDNERGLAVLASAGETDLLITGDMGASTERKLIRTYALPDLEALVAGHHGSRYSTSDILLDALTPETVCVSVGSNSYGHPSPETLDRLASHGCGVYRTDRDGNLHLVLDR